MATIYINEDAITFTAPASTTYNFVQQRTYGSSSTSYYAEWRGDGLGYTTGFVFPTSGDLTYVSYKTLDGKDLFSASDFSLNLSTVPAGVGGDVLIFLYIAQQASNSIIGSVSDDLLLATNNGDTVNGGRGVDTLVVYGASDDFRIYDVGNSGSTALVESLNAGSVASLISVEKIAFSDRTVDVSSFSIIGSYSVTATTSTVSEGNVATFTLSTTNVASGTSVSYSISGVSSSDVTGGLSGSVSVGSNGQATISVPIVADSTTEGNETLTVTAQGQSASTTINDTSITPVPTYNVNASSASFNEGSTATFTLSTINVAAGTGVAYTISGVSSADVVGGALSGSVNVRSDGQATISIPIAADNLTEGTETLTVTAQGKSASVAINDTSTGTTESDSSSIPQGNCNDPPVFAQIRLLFSMIDRFVPVFSCPGLDEAGVGCKTQSSH